jgi:hypothetical protein
MRVPVCTLMCIFRFSNPTRRQVMKRLFTGICMGLLLVLVLKLQLAQAQTTTTSAGPFSYDISQEVTLNGTVSSVLTEPSPGMVAGSHLLLTTPSGQVDVSLGVSGLRGKDALSVTGGQQLEVIGVMKVFKGEQVFFARTVTVGGHTYAIRNKNGIPVTPQARERAHENSQSGETR